MAPEVAKNDYYKIDKADVYSIGHIFYNIITLEVKGKQYNLYRN
jgi:hypothetical protein